MKSVRLEKEERFWPLLVVFLSGNGYPTADALKAMQNTQASPVAMPYPMMQYPGQFPMMQPYPGQYPMMQPYPGQYPTAYPQPMAQPGGKRVNKDDSASVRGLSDEQLKSFKVIKSIGAQLNQQYETLGFKAKEVVSEIDAESVVEYQVYKSMQTLANACTNYAMGVLNTYSNLEKQGQGVFKKCGQSYMRVLGSQFTPRHLEILQQCIDAKGRGGEGLGAVLQWMRSNSHKAVPATSTTSASGDDIDQDTVNGLGGQSVNYDSMASRVQRDVEKANDKLNKNQGLESAIDDTMNSVTQSTKYAVAVMQAARTIADIPNKVLKRAVADGEVDEASVQLAKQIASTLSSGGFNMSLGGGDSSSGGLFGNSSGFGGGNLFNSSSLSFGKKGSSLSSESKWNIAAMKAVDPKLYSELSGRALTEFKRYQTEAEDGKLDGSLAKINASLHIALAVRKAMESVSNDSSLKEENDFVINKINQTCAGNIGKIIFGDSGSSKDN